MKSERQNKCEKLKRRGSTERKRDSSSYYIHLYPCTGCTGFQPGHADAITRHFFFDRSLGKKYIKNGFSEDVESLGKIKSLW